MHLHLVRFQVLDRRPFDLFAYNATRELKYTGPATPPESGETGWKDTVPGGPAHGHAHHHAVRRLPRPILWHCHLLEHEDNEMMRPFAVVAVHHSAQ